MASPEEVLVKQAAGIAASVPVGLHGILADQMHAPRKSSRVILSLLPFGRRAYLEATGITAVESERHSLTDLGKQVVAICYEQEREWDEVKASMGVNDPDQPS